MTESENTGFDTKQQLPKLVVVLHWLLAASVIFLFVSSWWMLSLPLPSDEFTYREIPFQLHKNIGITLFITLFIMAARRVGTLYSDLREPDDWLQRLAIWDHLLLYILLAVCCISGYLSSSYSGWSTTLWWLVEMPTWSAESDELNILFSEIHMMSCWLLLALLLLHIGAALYHGLGNDGVIDKMFRLRQGGEK